MTCHYKFYICNELSISREILNSMNKFSESPTYIVPMGANLMTILGGTT